MCDVRAMEDTVIEMKYDAQKVPLGMAYSTVRAKNPIM